MRKAFLILLALVMVFSVAACGGNDAGGGGGGGGGGDDVIRVGFAQIGSESDWRVGNTVSVSDAIRGAGWELIFNDANQQQHLQIQAMRDFITQGVDYIVFAPIVETGWDSIMEEIADAGIPVVMIDRTIDMDNQEDYFMTWITNNFEEEGVDAAEWLIAYLEHTGRINDDINIVELQGTVGSGPQIYRQAGFADTLAAFPNLQITQSQTGDFTTELGKTVMESFLARAAADGTPIDVVFAHNDGMALGAIQAIREAGMVPGEDIILVGIDAVKLAFEAIIAGDMNVTVECSPLMGPLVVDVIEQHLAGRTPPKTIFNPRSTFDEELFDVFPDRFLRASDFVNERVY